jgi:hypothetical protein
MIVLYCIGASIEIKKWLIVREGRLPGHNEGVMPISSNGVANENAKEPARFSRVSFVNGG